MCIYVLFQTLTAIYIAYRRNNHKPSGRIYKDRSRIKTNTYRCLYFHPERLHTNTCERQETNAKQYTRAFDIKLVVVFCRRVVIHLLLYIPSCCSLFLQNRKKKLLPRIVTFENKNMVRIGSRSLTKQTITSDFTMHLVVYKSSGAS